MKKYSVMCLMVMACLIFKSRLASAQCGFPARLEDSPWSASTFYQKYNRPGSEREIAVVRQILHGNIPDELRKWATISLNARIRNRAVTIELKVTPDYLMVGNEVDFVRTPLTNYAAQLLASELGMFLPTPFLVDRIYDQADTKLAPQPTDWYKFRNEMRKGTNYSIFNSTIEAQRRNRGGLVAGHKKDVVLTPLLDRKPARVAIYGWQRTGNRPIQPLATPHDFTYEDYSHGIRLLAPTIKLTDRSTGEVQLMSLGEAYLNRDIGNFLNGGGGAQNDLRVARTCSDALALEFGIPQNQCPPQPKICPLIF